MDAPPCASCGRPTYVRPDNCTCTKNETCDPCIDAGAFDHYCQYPETCPKCGRELRPWPLKRGCAPKDWAHCIRNEGF